MKYHTQGQRFSGRWSVRVGVRRTALAVALVASGLATYVLVVAPASSQAAVRPTSHLKLARQSFAASATSQAVPTTHGHGDLAVSAVALTTSHLSPTTTVPSTTVPSTTVPSPTTMRSVTTTTRVVVKTPVSAHDVARPSAVSSVTTPVRHTAPSARTVATRTLTRTPPKRPTPAKPVAQRPAVTIAAAAAAKLAAHLNPAANIAPSPNFLQAGQCSQNGSTWSCSNPCLTSSMTWPAFANGSACTNFILQAIDNARAIEHLGPMTLPSNWYSLTTAQQLFVVADLERTARGLPPYLGINAALSAAAQRAAATGQDPAVAPGFAIGTDPQGYPAMGGAWSGGFSVLAADYMWMYDDGWGGSAAATSNVACTSARAAGCWAHRDELIGSDPGYNPGVGLTTSTCEVGVGFAMVNGSGSFVDLIEKPASTPPAMTFTWAANVVPYL